MLSEVYSKWLNIGLICFSIVSFSASTEVPIPYDFLNLAFNPQNLAMGNTFLSSDNGATSVLNNPARLPFVKSSMMVSYTRLFGEVDHFYSAVNFSLPRGLDLGLMLIYNGIGGLEYRNVINSAQPLGVFDVKQVAVVAGIGKQASNGLSLGANLVTVFQMIKDNQASNMLVNFFGHYQSSHYWELNVMARHIVANAIGQLVPQKYIEIGGAVYPMPGFTVSLQYPFYMNSRLSVGASYQLSDAFFIEGGVQNNQYAMGMSLIVADWTFHTAAVNTDYDMIYQFSLSRELGRPEDSLAKIIPVGGRQFDIEFNKNQHPKNVKLIFDETVHVRASLVSWNNRWRTQELPKDAMYVFYEMRGVLHYEDEVTHQIFDQAFIYYPQTGSMKWLP